MRIDRYLPIAMLLGYFGCAGPVIYKSPESYVKLQPYQVFYWHDSIGTNRYELKEQFLPVHLIRNSDSLSGRYMLLHSKWFDSGWKPSFYYVPVGSEDSTNLEIISASADPIIYMMTSARVAGSDEGRQLVLDNIETYSANTLKFEVVKEKSSNTSIGNMALAIILGAALSTALYNGDELNRHGNLGKILGVSFAALTGIGAAEGVVFHQIYRNKLIHIRNDLDRQWNEADSIRAATELENFSP